MPQVQRAVIQEVTPIPEADMIVCYKLSNGKQVVWAKGAFELGEIVLYIYEQSILPENLIEDLGLVGRLSGKDSNRVKAIRLKKTYSEGLILRDEVRSTIVNEDLDDYFGVTKYVAPIPGSLEGEVTQIDTRLIPNIDVKQDVSEIPPDAEILTVTEKIHGTNIRIGKLAESNPELFGDNNDIYICSKGLGNKGQVFVNTVDNVYTRMFFKYKDHFENMEPGNYFIGEVFGKGIQDLDYGYEAPELMEIVSYRTLEGSPVPTEYNILQAHHFPGTRKTFKDFIEGFDVESLDSVISKKPQMAEGVVALVKDYGFFKKVAQRYKLRHGGTEYN